MQTKPHLLVVEDETLVSEMLARALDDAYSVTTAATVTGAVRELRETKFAAILLDCLLPDADAAVVSAAAEAREVPVILMSGDPAQIGAAADLPFLAKPFSTEELERTLRSVLTWAELGSAMVPDQMAGQPSGNGKLGIRVIARLG
jgi:DNA-binding response OmpR family regulator